MRLQILALDPDVETLTAEPPYRDDEGGAPLRCCLRDSLPGERVRLVAVAPPGPAGAYVEWGPVFLHAEPCGGPAGAGYPAFALRRPQVLRAYDADGRITGGRTVDAGTDQEAVAHELFGDPAVEFLHSRNVVHGCYMFALRRADQA